MSLRFKLIVISLTRYLFRDLRYECNTLFPGYLTLTDYYSVFPLSHLILLGGIGVGGRLCDRVRNLHYLGDSNLKWVSTTLIPVIASSFQLLSKSCLPVKLSSRGRRMGSPSPLATPLAMPLAMLTALALLPLAGCARQPHTGTFYEDASFGNMSKLLQVASSRDGLWQHFQLLDEAASAHRDMHASSSTSSCLMIWDPFFGQDHDNKLTREEIMIGIMKHTDEDSLEPNNFMRHNSNM